MCILDIGYFLSETFNLFLFINFLLAIFCVYKIHFKFQPGLKEIEYFNFCLFFVYIRFISNSNRDLKKLNILFIGQELRRTLALMSLLTGGQKLQGSPLGRALASPK
jgi:hypothetical protein